MLMTDDDLILPLIDRVASPWTRAKPSKARSSSTSVQKTLHLRPHERISRDTVKDETEEDTSLSSPCSDEDTDGFFSLEADLDLNKLDLNEVNERCREQTSTRSSKRWSPTNGSRRLAREPDTLGNLEYKLRLLPPTRHRYDRLLTQLKWRLLQGGGFCTYEIGVLDDGRCVGICPIEMRASLRVLASLASELGACIRVRRAFMLVEAESGKGNTLQSLNNEEAQSKLLHQIIPDNGEENDVASACKCRAEGEALVWPEAKILGNYLEAEAVDGSGIYQVDIEEDAGSFLGGPWLGGSDESEAGEDEQSDNNLGEDGSHGQTFSLSLDEIATRTGIDYQQARPRRRCRYQAKSALHRRAKDASLEELPADAKERRSRRAGPRNMPDKLARPRLLHHTASDGIVETGELEPSDEAPSIAEAAIENHCERLIVEAIVSRPTDEQETADFIDYASL
jgi:hypothetical protein